MAQWLLRWLVFEESKLRPNNILSSNLCTPSKSQELPLVVLDGPGSLQNTKARHFCHLEKLELCHMPHSSIISSRGRDSCLSWDQRPSSHSDCSPESANKSLAAYLTVFNCDLLHLFSHLCPSVMKNLKFSGRRQMTAFYAVLTQCSFKELSVAPTLSPKAMFCLRDRNRLAIPA